MLFHIYNPYDNKTVTDYYVSIIASAIQKSGNDTLNVCRLTKNNKSLGVVTVSVADSIEARKLGYYPIILWVQGIIPEESFMRNHSILRKTILSIHEKKGLKAADILLYVSESMRKHFSYKYHFDAKHYFIMPCFNSELDYDAFFHEGRYKNNQFVYAGGLQTWQCFEQSVKLYSLIEKKVDSCELRVLTKDKQSAERIVKANGVKHYSIGFVPQDSINKELVKSKFGFALREKNEVNYVSTPTKLSTYISNGVLPIYTDAIGDFSKLAENNRYCLSVDLKKTNEAVDKLVNLCNVSIKPEDVLLSFRDSFGNYYSKDYHIKNLCKLISDFQKAHKK